MTSGGRDWNSLPREMRETLRAYLNDVTTVFGTTLESAILYGSAARGEFQPGRSNLNVLLLLARHDIEALTRYAKVHRRWKKEGIVVPLLFTSEDLRASLDLFPLEYLELRRDHVVLSGKDPFAERDPDARKLSLQCLQEIQSNLLRVRQRFVEGGGSSETMALLIPLSITGLLPSLRGLAHLLGRSGSMSADTLLQELGTSVGMDTAVLADAWRMKTGVISPGQHELPRLFARYVSSLETLGEQAAKALQSRSG